MDEREISLEEMALELIDLAHQYAANVIFMNHRHRKVLQRFAALVSEVLELREKRRRKCWIKKWHQRRSRKGSFTQLSSELREEDPQALRNYLRMTDEQFNIVLQLIEADIKKEDTNMRKAVTPKEQLAATLRYLATGESYRSLEYQTRLSQAYLVECIPKVCAAIWKNMRNLYLKFPDTPAQWSEISKHFEIKWNFPLCLGALDGKHVNFYASEKDGSYFHNYKGTDSIVLLALVDANCKFIYVDVGCNGRANDGGVLNQSPLQQIINNGAEHFPFDKVIGNNRLLPHAIVADSAFALHKHVMKPFSHQTNDNNRIIFNKRLSRARQVVERAFGILSAKFQIFKKPINLRKLENIENIVLACCVLHNFLTNFVEPVHEIPDHDLATESQNNSPEIIRTTFMEYFNQEGKLNWINP